jgi:lysine 2,3-aminomutase
VGKDFVEPDWRRLPGFRDVTEEQWHDARWQRRRSVKDARGLKEVFGAFLDDALADDIARDQDERATMSMLVTPQMLNTMDERDLRGDPVRVYMAPAFSERHPRWPSHPFAERDSLRERDMWVVEGLTHRYPTKVLAELVQTCPQYCGHCTRMDLVGRSTPRVEKYRMGGRYRDRSHAMLDYLRAHPEVRDVVVSGGDIANVPVARLEEFVGALVDIPNIREVRLASKSLVGLPQHFLQRDMLAAVERLAAKAQDHGVSISLHTHANHASQVTPLVARAARSLLDLGLRNIRNQAVLLRGVNADGEAQIALCERLLYDAQIVPYYVFMCDMIPGAEHWRTALWEAQEIQQQLMGRLPGYATPRVVCDVPGLGKKWVHQVDGYDEERGISRWSKRYRIAADATEPEGSPEVFRYYDPIHTLTDAGREWWIEQEVAGGVAR